MGIKAFTDAVQERLVDVLREAAYAKAPTFALGWKSTLVEYGPIPRITWVPKNGPTKGADVDGDDALAPRKLGVRQLLFGVHIWGDDIDDCEVLANALIQALQHVAWGSFRVVGEEWEEGTAAEVTKDGQLFVLGVEAHMPWTRAITARTKVAVTIDVTPSATTGGA